MNHESGLDKFPPNWSLISLIERQNNRSKEEKIKELKVSIIEDFKKQLKNNQ
jgi:hypothetical protein